VAGNTAVVLSRRRRWTGINYLVETDGLSEQFAQETKAAKIKTAAHFELETD
jgi:hypothetical protein